MEYNKSLKKVEMPEQAPNVRNRNFEEVAQGYTAKMAQEEASRCLGCKKQPCVGGCPVNVHIPEFIAKVKDGDFLAAYDIIRETNALPAVCGRVCPQESQCEGQCVRGKKVSRWASVVWSGFAPIMLWPTKSHQRRKNRCETGRKSRWLAVAPAALPSQEI